MHRYRLLTMVCCAAAAGLLAATVGGQLSVDGFLLDLLVKGRSLLTPAAVPAQEPVAVIALDRRSLDAPELLPYPRAFLAPIWATVLEGVFTAGARAVGFDLLFAYSANQFTANFDQPFLATLGTYRERVVLGRSATTLPAPPFLAALRYDTDALGLMELIADRDGTYRHLHASYETRSVDTVASFASALLRQAQAPAMPASLVLAPQQHVERIPTYALIDVLRCTQQAPEAVRQAFAGTIVLIGSTLPEEDRRWSSGRFLSPQPADAPPLHACGLRRLGASVPNATSVPGVFLHAAAIEAVVRGRVTTTAPPLMVALLAAVTAAVGASLGLVLAPWLAVAAVLGLVVMLGLLATGLLIGDLWLPLVLPLLALALAPGLAYVVRYLVEERSRRRIEHAFCHYLSPTIVAQLAENPATLRLGGSEREVTVMFADLSGFTALSGKVAPEVLMRTTNQYLAYIVEQVEATGGYVDKFIGDAVLALWGAPVADTQHAMHGIGAALAAVVRIQQARLAAEARGEIGFAVKIGLNSGPAVVGNVGTEKRYNYTAVGETVNVASRLESIPSLYACQVVVGPRTAELAHDAILLCELDWIQVKGKETPLAIFEPLAPYALATEAQRMYAARFAEALAHYRAMRFTEAATIWEDIAESRGAAFPVQPDKGHAGANPAATMAVRARAYAAQSPEPAWNGVWVLTSK
jgi:class 3 adenylate cyclase/CHASE2 domain-containing sensor protein